MAGSPASICVVAGGQFQTMAAVVIHCTGPMYLDATGAMALASAIAGGGVEVERGARAPDRLPDWVEEL